MDFDILNLSRNLQRMTSARENNYIWSTHRRKRHRLSMSKSTKTHHSTAEQKRTWRFVDRSSNPLLSTSRTFSVATMTSARRTTKWSHQSCMQMAAVRFETKS